MVELSYILSYECLKGGRVTRVAGSPVDYVTLFHEYLNRKLFRHFNIGTKKEEKVATLPCG